MVDSKISNTLIYNEIENKDLFDLARQKFIHNIDNIYYSVYLDDDYYNKQLNENTNVNVQRFILDLQSYEADLINNNYEPLEFESTGLIFTKKNVAGIYKFNLCENSFFDIFIAERLPNASTPRIHVQIRSFLLWSSYQDECSSLDYTYEKLIQVLNKYNLKVKKIDENRIDYAFHTNCIRDINKYFSTEFIEKHLKSSLTKGCQIFDLERNCINYNYLSLGMRSSNSIFYRTYYKVYEILDKSKKYYFFDVWRDEGLISNYDYKIYNLMANNYIRDNFYLTMFNALFDFYNLYGKSCDVKNYLDSLKNNDDLEIYKKLKLISKVLPLPTPIINIEFQTMRRFYAPGCDFINSLCCVGKYSDLLHLYKILQNREYFINYFTKNTVYYDCYFWKRLRSLKFKNSLSLNNKKYKRKYKKSDTEFNAMIINKLSKFYKSLADVNLELNNLDTNFYDDISSLLNTYNDNHFLNYSFYKDKRKKKKSAASPICELPNNNNN